MSEVSFKDLSLWLKAVVIFGYVNIGLWVFWFMYGVFEAIILGV